MQSDWKRPLAAAVTVVAMAATVAIAVAIAQARAGEETAAAARLQPSGAPAVPEQITVDGVPLKLAFDDEFDRLNLWNGTAGTWRTSFHFKDATSPDHFSLTSNRERQLYVDAGFRGTGEKPLGLDPFSVSDGVLTITASRIAPAMRRDTWDYAFASGLITTRESFTQAYGWFEMRARLPQGKGYWPAFWLARRDGAWPPELDVVEVLGDQTDRVYTALHSRALAKGKSTGASHPVGAVDDGFHTYGALWTPQTISWWFDGREIARTTTPADMHSPMYLLANLAVGGKWPGDPDGSTPFPGEMKIDWIRAYALAEPAVKVVTAAGSSTKSVFPAAGRKAAERSGPSSSRP